MFTGKILTTMVAITTAVILLSQLNASSDIISDIYEPYVNHAMTIKEVTTCGKKCKAKNKKSGKKLTGHYPDSLFVSSYQLEPATVMGTGTVFQGNTESALSIQAMVNGQNPSSVSTAFANFETASGVVDEGYRENFDLTSSGSGCANGCTASPCGCDSGNNGYGQQNLMKPDYNALGTSDIALPMAGMTAYDLPAEDGDIMNAQGEIESVHCTSRLMYSTQTRYGSGSAVTDMIRGDIPICGSQPQSQTAASASDSLSTGAMFVLGGMDNNTSQLAAAQITASSGGSRTALGGVDAAYHVATDDRSPGCQSGQFCGLTGKDFLSTSANLYLDLEENNGTPSRTVRSSTALGEVSVDTGRPNVVTGYTNF